MVPAVICAVDCVRIISISEDVPWKGSRRVGLVITVWRLFSVRKCVNL